MVVVKEIGEDGEGLAGSRKRVSGVTLYHVCVLN